MLRGVQLKISVGVVPVPVPSKVLDGLVVARVHTGSGSAQSGFELVFEFPANSRLQALFLATSGVPSSVAPFVRVVLLVVINGRTEPLMDGVITHVASSPSASSTVQVTVWGKDLSALMDREELRGEAFPAQGPAAQARSILTKYHKLGILPIVVPTLFDLPALPSQHVDQQHGTDYVYLSQLAADVGHVFYVETGPLNSFIGNAAGAAVDEAVSRVAGGVIPAGLSRAYWGPEVRVGWPQPALTTGMDALNTVDELSFDFDREQNEMPAVYTEVPVVHRMVQVPIPSVTPLDPPLGLVPPLPPKLVHLPETSGLSFGKALLRGMAHSAGRSHALRASGKLDVTRYGHVLRSRRLVGVRGAGYPYDGLHYVTQVSHELTRGSYTQSFQLSRNGLFPTVPRVPV